MDNLDFLQGSAPGDASLSVFHADGISAITGLNTDVISSLCPLLALAFEDGPTCKRYTIEGGSRDLIASFLRFLYTGDYKYASYNNGLEHPCSLLLHAQLYHMAVLYDVPELRCAAQANITCETEYACSSPSPPPDLCEAIHFIYEHLFTEQHLIDTVVHYCVACFLYHRLGDDEAFQKLAYELLPFHQDLIKTNFYRGFSDESAVEIVRLPTSKSSETRARQMERMAMDDFISEMWNDPEDLASIEGVQTGTVNQSNANPPATLPHRPHVFTTDIHEAADNDTSSEESDFAFVPRPKSRRSDSNESYDLCYDATQSMNELSVVNNIRYCQEILPYYRDIPYRDISP
ncbi:hypothetical protein BJ546DRAFT_1060297 [Cryomyces antarcticus]